MGNPQETLSQFELGWFAGFVDGEGAIGITTRFRCEKGRKYETPKPHLQISNTEYILIEKMMHVLDTLKCPYHISEYKVSSRGNRKKFWTVVIAGQKRVMKILPIIEPLLQSCKKEKARLVMDYCISRESRVKGQGYTEYEQGIIDKLYQLNGRGLDEKAPQRLHARRVENHSKI